MGKYVIVVESGSDVTPELCERYGIVRVPMHVTIGDETVEDGSIDPLEIYSRCNEFGVMPKTSGCSPADFAHVYDRIHAEQPDATILHLAYSEATTCSHQSSKIAAQGRDYVDVAPVAAQRNGGGGFGIVKDDRPLRIAGDVFRIGFLRCSA